MLVKKDPKTGAVLNTDVEALNKYKLERKYYRKVDSIHEDLTEIKRCIAALYEKIEKLDKN